MLKLNVETTKALIKSFEGFSDHPYMCPTGYWTIGYGHVITLKEIQLHGASDENLAKILYPEALTKYGAGLLLAEDINKIIVKIDPLITVPLNENQSAVIISFVFNVGLTAFKTSTLLKKLNQGDYGSVPAELKRWNKGTINGNKVVILGIVNRREKESALWSEI